MANQIDSLGCSRRLSHNGLSQQTIMREGVFSGLSLSLSLSLAPSLPLFPPHRLILPVFNFSALLLSLFSSASKPPPILDPVAEANCAWGFLSFFSFFFGVLQSHILLAAGTKPRGAFVHTCRFLSSCAARPTNHRKCQLQDFSSDDTLKNDASHPLINH